MHAKPDLRVFLKWMIAGSGSVITDVIRLGLQLMRFPIRILILVIVASALVSALLAYRYNDLLYVLKSGNIELRAVETTLPFCVGGSIGSVADIGECRVVSDHVNERHFLALQKLPNLKHLLLVGSFPPEYLEHLKHCKSLVFISIDEPIDLATAEKLANIDSLCYLSISDYSTESVFELLKLERPKLQLMVSMEKLLDQLLDESGG